MTAALSFSAAVFVCFGYVLSRSRVAGWGHLVRPLE